jgi:hypothetical protein
MSSDSNDICAPYPLGLWVFSAVIESGYRGYVLGHSWTHKHSELEYHWHFHKKSPHPRLVLPMLLGAGAEKRISDQAPLRLGHGWWLGPDGERNYTHSEVRCFINWVYNGV